MKTIAITAVGDQGLVLNKSSVDLNDVLAVKGMLDTAGFDAKVIDRDNLAKAHDYDVLFVKCGVIVNWGGTQTKHFQKYIKLINDFDGPVFLMSVDQDFVFPNQEREGFLTINRPVYFLYSGKNAKEIANKQLKDFDVIDSAQFYQGVQVGKQLSQMPFLKVEPIYDAVYGGQARKELLKRLVQISESYSLLTYGNVRKKVPKSIGLNGAFDFDSRELRSVNSMGKHSFIFFKPKTPWLTPRIFEQLCSNSMVLFDTRWDATKPFWTDKNTFSSQDELMERMSYEPTKADIDEQHGLALSFDYDKYNEEQLSNIIDFLK